MERLGPAWGVCSFAAVYRFLRLPGALSGMVRKPSENRRSTRPASQDPQDVVGPAPAAGPSANARPAVVSPETLAVALAGEQAEGSRVVASGRGYVADQILQTAFENGIRVREDADLVQVLAALDLDEEIPMEAIAAVSEILHYLYQANAGHGSSQSDANG